MESEAAVSNPQELGVEKMNRKQGEADASVPAGKGDGDNGNGIVAGKGNKAVEAKGDGAGPSKENEAGSKKGSESVNEKGKEAVAGKKRGAFAVYSVKKRNAVTEKGNDKNDQGTGEGDCVRKDASGSNKFKKKREQENYKNGSESAPEKSDDKGQSGQGNSWKHGKNRKNSNEYYAVRKYEKENSASPDSPSEKPGASDTPPEKHGRVTPEERKPPSRGGGKRSPSLAPDGPYENRGHPNPYRGQESPVTFEEFLRLLGEGGFTVRRDVYRRKYDFKDSLSVPSWICAVHADKHGKVYFEGVGASNRTRTVESSYKHPDGQQEKKYTHLFPEGAIDNATFDLMRHAQWNGLVVPPLKQFCFVTIDPNALLEDGNLVGRPLWRNVAYPPDLRQYERMERLSGEVKLNKVKIDQNVRCRNFYLALEKCVKQMEKTRKFKGRVGDDKGLPVEDQTPIPTNGREEEMHIHEWDLPREVVERDTRRYPKAELDEVGTSAGGQRVLKGESVANGQGDGPKVEPEEIRRKIQPTVDDGKAIVQVAAPVQTVSVKNEKVEPEVEKQVKWSEETEQSVFSPDEMSPATDDTKVSKSDAKPGSEGGTAQSKEGNSLEISRGTGLGGRKQSPKNLSGGHVKPGDEDESEEASNSEPIPADCIAADVDPGLIFEGRKNGLARQEGKDEIGTSSAATSDDAVKDAGNIDEDVVDARSVKSKGDGAANKQNPVKDGNSFESGTTETSSLPDEQSAFSRDDGAGNEVQSPAAGDNLLFGLLAVIGIIAVFCNWALPFIYTVLGIFSSFFLAIM